MTNVVPIGGVPRHYDWGSRTAIPTLLGRPSDGRPLGELWFGAHPDSPSPVVGQGVTLDDFIADDPDGTLGPVVLAAFGPHLPFLVKILAPDKALSIQAHPNRHQAQAGFAAEDSAGIERTAAHRSYRDRNHKPELVCALTPFDAMCGFRRPETVREILAELALPELDFLEAALTQPDPLRTAFTAVLTHPDHAAAVDALTGRVAGATAGPFFATRLAADDYPGDAGIVLTLLLNVVRLQPGESLYLGAGNVHAYLRGTAVEVMANSDNVLRCGLTPKHRDVPELLRIVDFTELPDPRWPSRAGRFDVPVPDFTMTRLVVKSPTIVQDAGPQIVLCTSGSVRVDDVPIGPGQALFIRAAAPCSVVGDGLVFVAGVGALDP